jgi:hypothetical protein
MSDTATSEFDDVQRIVLRGGAAPGSGWRASAHLLIDFGKHSPLHFISRLLAGQPDAGLPPVSADGARTLEVPPGVAATARLGQERG